jgi:hypothetical protein
MYRILVQSCDISTGFQRSIIIFELNLDCNDGRRPLFQIRTPTESRVLLLGALRRKAFVRLHLDRREPRTVDEAAGEPDRGRQAASGLGWEAVEWNGGGLGGGQPNQTNLPRCRRRTRTSKSNAVCRFGMVYTLSDAASTSVLVAVGLVVMPLFVSRCSFKVLLSCHLPCQWWG